MLTFDALCPRGQTVQIVDHPVQDRTVPAATQTPHSPAPVSNGRAAPVFHSQFPFPTEYPDGFTTFTPSLATTPCPHTCVTTPSVWSS
jgi:hypothetical protein